MSKLTPLTKIIKSYQGKKILVIGDLILDEYIKGSVSRISPEAPVPVVLQEGEPRFTPGGSANVAHNLSSLGAKVTVAGKVGQDREAQILRSELEKRSIDISGVFADKHAPTALKTRVIAQHQQLVRIDREDAWDLDRGGASARILAFVMRKLKEFDGIIISDYGKGVVTEDLVERVCRLAIQKKKIITVDPKVEHFNYYARVTTITPNKKEAENAIRNIIISHEKGRSLKITDDRLRTLADVEKAGQALVAHLKLQSLLITLGEEGMYLFEKGKDAIHIETKAKEVFDVTGAGDTVISVFTLSLAAGATKLEAALLANYAAGIVVGKMGAVAVKPQEILDALKGE